jgi:hypothetical protein
LKGLIPLAGTHGQGQMMGMITLHPKNKRREKGKAIKVGILEVMMLKQGHQLNKLENNTPLGWRRRLRKQINAMEIRENKYGM